MSKIRLWKYMSNFEFLLDILENKRLYLANINKMNDPLEYYIPLRFSDTDVKNILDIKGVNYSFEKNMEYSLGSFPLNISDFLFAKKNYENKELTNYLKTVKYYTVAKKHIENAKICSLSNSKNHPLMWSHYANGHTGYCVEISIDPGRVEKVKYENFKERGAELSNNYKRDTLKCLKHKHESWAYEEEYRIISFNKNQYFDDFKIENVTLGSSISKFQKEFIESLCKRKKIEHQTINSFSTNGLGILSVKLY